MSILMNKAKRQNKKGSFKKHWQLHLFLLLPVVYVLIFRYYPIYGVQIAFKQFNPAKGILGSPWVGLTHFKTFFKSYQFKRVITNTLSISLYSLLAGFPLPIIFALFLNALPNQRLKKFIQTVTYIPHFVSVVVIVGMMVQILNPVTGLYGTVHRMIHGTGYPKDLMASPSAFIHLYIWSGIWRQLGWNSIIYIAALAGINQELIEAAIIDGASRWKIVLNVELPSIYPTIVILLILRVGSIMDVGFEKVYLMQNTLNLAKSEVISTYVYKVGVAAGRSNFSFASAVGLFNSVINSILLILVNTISRKLGETSLW